MCTALQSVGTSLPRSSTSYLSGSILASSRWLGQFELWRNFAAAMFFTLSHLSGSSLAGCLGQFGLWRNLPFGLMLILMPMLSDPGGSWECQFATKSMSAVWYQCIITKVRKYQYINVNCQITIQISIKASIIFANVKSQHSWLVKLTDNYEIVLKYCN